MISFKQIVYLESQNRTSYGYFPQVNPHPNKKKPPKNPEKLKLKVKEYARCQGLEIIDIQTRILYLSCLYIT